MNNFIDTFLSHPNNLKNFSFLKKDMYQNKNQNFYFEMKLIRTFEEKLLNLFEKNLIGGTTHTYIGQESNSTAIFDFINKQEDIIWSNHRCHGHFISYCGKIIDLMAEIVGKKDGICNGRGGSQHLNYKNFYSNGILGGSLPQALGASYAIKDNKDAIAVVFIGDGTLGSGYLYETMNLASLWSCPILFICENNFIAQTTPSKLTLSGEISLRPKAFGISTYECYEYNIKDISAISKKAIEEVRQERRPVFLEIGSVRLGPHSKGDDTREDITIEKIKNLDPMVKIKNEIDDFLNIDEMCAKIINKTFEIVNEFEDAE